MNQKHNPPPNCGVFVTGDGNAEKPAKEELCHDGKGCLSFDQEGRGSGISSS